MHNYERMGISISFLELGDLGLFLPKNFSPDASTQTDFSLLANIGKSYLGNYGRLISYHILKLFFQLLYLDVGMTELYIIVHLQSGYDIVNPF